MLDCFGDELTKFSISHYLWDKIFQASEDVVKHFPYAPYIMHIIEQESGLNFPIDAPHRVLKVSNKMSLQAKKALEKAAKRQMTRCFGFLLPCFSTSCLSLLLC